MSLSARFRSAWVLGRRRGRLHRVERRRVASDPDQSSEFRVQSSEFRVQSSEFRLGTGVTFSRLGTGVKLIEEGVDFNVGSA